MSDLATIKRRHYGFGLLPPGIVRFLGVLGLAERMKR